MRVISGRLGGRRLVAARGQRTRPTSDLVRKSLFDMLGPSVEGTLFVDAFAGSGAVGIEAASRGAGWVVFVESDAAALAALRANVSGLGLDGRVSVLAADALGALRDTGRLLGGVRNLGVLSGLIVFGDPPYDKGLAPAWVQACAAGVAGLCAGAGSGLAEAPCRVIVQHSRREGLGQGYGDLVRLRERSYGDTVISVYGNVSEGSCRP